MNTVGSLLKNSRMMLHLSLKEVCERCGITDSRLSRIERGEKLPDPMELNLLAGVYELDIVSLFIAAGYLTADVVSDQRLVFQNAHLLSEDERQAIQNLINLMTEGRRNTSAV